MCWRHRKARQPLAAIWVTPCITMAVCTGTTNSKKPISSMPPAMPKMPEMNEVAVTTTASAASIGRENIGGGRSAG